MMINALRLPFVAMAMSVILFGVSPIDSFQPSPTISTPYSLLAIRNSHGSEPKYLLTKSSPRPMSYSSLVLKSSQDDSNGEGNAGSSLSVDAILGITASLVVLYSEYTLKTTGCGLPAGPFGVVGAVEGVSYLGVVGICANAASKYFSDQDEGGDTGARRIATTLGVSAALVGITVLAFQVADYGYIPNAVPMEGGMCK